MLPTLYISQEGDRHTSAAALGYKNAVVRTPDTDIFVILLFHARTIKLTVYLDNKSAKHRRLRNISELAQSLGEEYCATLLGFYVFSGEDCTSAFKGNGQVGPIKKLHKNPRFHNAFRQLCRMECPTSDTKAVGTVHLPDVQTVASLRLMSFVLSCFERWWARIRSSPPSLKLI